MYLGIMLQPVLILRQKTLINKQTKQIYSTRGTALENNGAVKHALPIARV